MEQNNREEVEIDLKQIFYLLLDKLFIILTCGVLVGVLAFAYTKLLVKPIYQSVTTTFVVKNEEQSGNLDSSDFVTGNYLSKNYVEIVQSNTVFEEVIDVLELDMSVAELREKVQVENITETQIIKITVGDTDPGRAQEIANAVRIASEKAIVRIVDVPGVQCVDSATYPKTPSSPNVAKNVIIGALIGVFLSIVIIVVRFVMDDSIKSPEDIERYLGMSTLASIPIMEEAEYDGTKHSTKKNVRLKKKAKKEVVR